MHQSERANSEKRSLSTQPEQHIGGGRKHFTKCTWKKTTDITLAACSVSCRYGCQSSILATVTFNLQIKSISSTTNPLFQITFQFPILNKLANRNGKCKRLQAYSEGLWKGLEGKAMIMWLALSLVMGEVGHRSSCQKAWQMLENVWICFFVFAAAEHAGWNRAEGGGLVRVVCAQRELAYGGEGSHQGRGRAAGREAQDAEGQPAGVAASAPRQTDQHSGKWLFPTGFLVGRSLGDFIVLCSWEKK